MDAFEGSKQLAERVREKFNEIALKAEECNDPIERAWQMFSALRILRSIEKEPVRPILYEAMVQYSKARFEEFSADAIKILTSERMPNFRYQEVGGGQWISREDFFHDCQRRAPQLIEAWPLLEEDRVNTCLLPQEEDQRLAQKFSVKTRETASQTEAGIPPSKAQSLKNLIGSRPRPAQSRKFQESRIPLEEDPKDALPSVSSMPKFRVPEPVGGRGADRGRSARGRGAVRGASTQRKHEPAASRQEARPRHQEKEKEETTSEEKNNLPERLRGCDPELVKRIENEIMEKGRSITFDDVAGLDAAKRSITELVIWPMRRPELFVGLRALPRGMLLFGPPGTGKTMIGRAIASSCAATFFAISASSLTSKWIGESEKLVRTLFAVAGHKEPSVVFVDEVDSLLSQRSAEENESSRRLKTEFLVQLEGVDTSKSDERVLIVGATNKPNELDEAARRRFVKRFYVPLPDDAARHVLFRVLLKNNTHALESAHFDHLVKATDGFSGADIRNLAQEASMGPVRDLGPALFSAPDTTSVVIPPITLHHFNVALAVTRPTVAPSEITFYQDWDQQFGTAAPAPPALPSSANNKAHFRDKSNDNQMTSVSAQKRPRLNLGIDTT